MTAEIAILNKEAVALAADSAATVTSNKIFKSANKLHALSKYQPVGIMIYGNSHFIGIPWETIIKLYRTRLGVRKLPKLEDYAQDFMHFLEDYIHNIPQSVQFDYLLNDIEYYFRTILASVMEEFQYEDHPHSDLIASFLDDLKSTITDCLSEWNLLEATSVFNVNQSEVLEKYEENIEHIISSVFTGYDIDELCNSKLKQMAFNILTKNHESIPSYTGVVVAGFGDDEIFPSIDTYSISGAFENTLKCHYLQDKSSKIDFSRHAEILAFAQDGIVNRFIQGIDPSYVIIIDQFMSGRFGENSEEKAALLGLLADEVRKNLLPIEDVVATLPKAEIAELAESLVNITSLNKKVTMQAETVSAPIDVAIITKGDGLIWIKRKHYFDAKLNPQYFSRNIYNDLNTEDTVDRSE